MHSLIITNVFSFFFLSYCILDGSFWWATIHIILMVNRILHGPTFLQCLGFLTNWILTLEFYSYLHHGFVYHACKTLDSIHHTCLAYQPWTIPTIVNNNINALPTLIESVFIHAANLWTIYLPLSITTHVDWIVQVSEINQRSSKRTIQYTSCDLEVVAQLWKWMFSIFMGCIWLLSLLLL